MIFPCGCSISIDPVWGVLRSWRKCVPHSPVPPTERKLEYYEQMIESITRRIHKQQFEEAFGELGPALSGETVMEIGCGVSVYAGMLLEAGYKYVGVEPCEAGAAWTSATYNVPVIRSMFPLSGEHPKVDVIVAAHVLEHVPDAPLVLRAMFDILKPGGELYLIVPDDSDLFNPDHLWFFNFKTLPQFVNRFGFLMSSLVSRQYIDRESFLYLKAVKE